MSAIIFSLKLYPRMDKTNKEGLIPVYARLMADKKIELSTTMLIPLKEWNGKTQRLNAEAKDSATINAFLDSFCSKVLKAYSTLFIEGKTITTDGIRDQLFGKTEKERGLIQILTEHNKNFEQRIGLDYSYGSYKNYKTTYKYLQEFIKVLYRKTDIPISAVNYGFCEKFYHFLISTKPCKNNGANKHIQRLKKIVNYSYKMGYIKTNQLLAYSLKFIPFHQQKLTWKEIEKLQELKLHNVSLIKVRDVFLFQCFTGLAYSDVKNLSYKDIIIGVDGAEWLSMKRTKTKIEFSLPLLQPAKTILQTYKQESYNDNDKVLPVICNQKMNAYLKIIAEVVGINKTLSTHVARHSFASTITLQQGVPLETVSKMLGHKKISTTQIFAVVNQQKISNDMEAVKNKFVLH